MYISTTPYLRRSPYQGPWSEDREVRQEQGNERFVRLQHKCMRPCMMQPNETVAHHYSVEYLKMPTSIVLFKIVSSQIKNKHGNLTAVNWIASFIDT